MGNVVFTTNSNVNLNSKPINIQLLHSIGCANVSSWAKCSNIQTDIKKILRSFFIIIRQNIYIYIYFFLQFVISN